MQKNQIIILVIIVIVVLGGLVVWSLVQQPAVPLEEEVEVEVEEEEELAEVFSMSAIVSSVDVANNFLMVRPANQEEDVKVLIAETTRLIRLEFPFDPADPPAEATFTPTQTEIETADFRQGDNIFIKAKDNIAGKTEFGNVDFIHILP